MRVLFYSIATYSAAAGFIALICADILFKGWGFVLGDYAIQHLPWSDYYWKVLKEGELPLWTSLIQTGFPLLAEGQVGALYPFRLLLFSFLPFKTAYAAEPLLHFFLGWFFSFVYLRTLSLSRTASWLGGMFFIFGSAYAGCFTNTVSMRVVIWFPALLWICTKALEAAQRRGWREVLLWMVPFSCASYCQWTGGFIQYACYSQVMVLWYGLAVLIWLFLKGRLGWFPSMGLLLWLFVAMGTGILLAGPQLLPTLELAQFSPRLELANLDFALIGSWLPTGFLSLFIPSISNLATPFLLYVGLVPLALAVIGALRSSSFIARFIFISFLICTAAALGQFNPLYVWVLERIGWYGFRMPAKWLVFAAFWLSALAAIGFDSVRFQLRDESVRRKMATLLLIIGFLSVAIAAVMRILALSGAWLRNIAHWYLEYFILKNPYHQQPPAVYEEKVEHLLALLKDATSPASNRWLLISLGISLILVLLGWFWKKGWLSHAFVQLLLIFVALIDLYFFSFYGTGFKGNLAPLPELDKSPPFFEELERPAAGRLFVLLEGPESYAKLVLVPNQNMSFNVATVGAYSPLLVQSFTDYLGDLGGVDDSLGIKAGTAATIESGLERLHALHATYIYSLSPLPNIDALRLEKQHGEHRLYRNLSALPRAFLVSAAHFLEEEKEALAHIRSSAFQPEREVILLGTPPTISVTHPTLSLRERVKGEGDASHDIEKLPISPLSSVVGGKVQFRELSPTHLSVKIKSSSPAFLVISDLFYPGWKATLNGESAPILRANLVMRALPLEAGEHLVEMIYQPGSWKQGWQCAAVGMAALLLLVIFCWISHLGEMRRMVPYR